MRNQPGAELEEQIDAYAATVQANTAAGKWRERLRAWSAYAGAAGSALAFATAAEADIIYSGIQNARVSTSTHRTTYGGGGLKGIHMNVGAAGRPEFDIAVQFVKARTYVFGRLRTNAAAFLVPTPRNFANGLFLRGAFGSSLKRFASGAAISSGAGRLATYLGNLIKKKHTEAGATRSYGGRVPSTHSTHGTWPKNASGFAGVRFNLGSNVKSTAKGGGPANTGGQPHFGWIRLRWQDTGNGNGFPTQVTAIDWAYNDVAGAPILAGEMGSASAVPEPSSLALALMALGAAGVAAWRKRRQSAPESDRESQ